MLRLRVVSGASCAASAGRTPAPGACACRSPARRTHPSPLSGPPRSARTRASGPNPRRGEHRLAHAFPSIPAPCACAGLRSLDRARDVPDYHRGSCSTSMAVGYNPSPVQLISRQRLSPGSAAGNGPRAAGLTTGGGPRWGRGAPKHPLEELFSDIYAKGKWGKSSSSPYFSAIESLPEATAASPLVAAAKQQQSAVDYVLSLYDSDALGGTAPTRSAPRNSGTTASAPPSGTATPAWTFSMIVMGNGGRTPRTTRQAAPGSRPRKWRWRCDLWR